MSFEDEQIDANEMAIEEGEQDNPIRRAAIERMDEWWLRGLRLVMGYEGDRLMALDCWVAAMGNWEMLGRIERTISKKNGQSEKRMVDIKSAVDIAVKHFADERKKATVTKCMQRFYVALKIAGMPGQRSGEGCVAMKKARNKQLQKEKTNK